MGEMMETKQANYKSLNSAQGWFNGHLLVLSFGSLGSTSDALRLPKRTRSVAAWGSTLPSASLLKHVCDYRPGTSSSARDPRSKAGNEEVQIF